MTSFQVKFAEADKDKRILIGPALIPDKPIYRNNGEEEFHVYFSKTTIRRAMELFFKYGNQGNTTLEHEHKLPHDLKHSVITNVFGSDGRNTR